VKHRTSSEGSVRATLFAWLVLMPVISRAGAAESEQILLWPQGAPGTEGRHSTEKVRINEYGEHIVSNIHFPSITPYLPVADRAAKAAVIVVPGGGHRELWMDHEGYRVAQYLADHHIAAFVLRYRLAREPGSSYTVERDALADLQRAIRLVRSRAPEWQLDPQSVGVIGFSAGGELVALASVRFDAGAPSSSDSVERFSSKPAFQALFYPALPKQMQLRPDMSPTFLLCGADDEPAVSQGSAELYLSLRRAGASAELHEYAGVGHGFGLRPNNQGPAAMWPQQLLQWMTGIGMTKEQ
jgi:endo-1,4-beta-xylanase